MQYSHIRRNDSDTDWLCQSTEEHNEEVANLSSQFASTFGFDDIARIVMSYDNVESVYLAASSRYDLIAMVKGSTIQEIAEFVSKRLSTLDNVIGTATSFVLTHYKSGGVSFYDSDEDREQRSMIL